jgi:general L-amino acid transport system permease protein
MFWRNEKFLGLFYQGIVVALLVGAGAYFAHNAQSALGERGITTGFSFLEARSGFAISEGIVKHTPQDSYLNALIAGAVNTLTVSLASIIGATLVGLLVGLCRLSGSRLLSGLAAAYVETFRNTPQLLQIVMWYLLLTLLPGPRQAIGFVSGAIFVNNRGVNIPVLSNGVSLFTALLIALVLSGLALETANRLVDRYQRRTGGHLKPWPIAVCAIALAGAASWVLVGLPEGLNYPEMAGFKYRGGQTLSPEFLALFLGLSLYIGAFIAEIVRAGLQSIPRGQHEAADSIPLGRYDKLRLVVLPQAMRVMVPPATAQYVSLLKNSSLGVAIGYPELFNVTNTTTTLSGQALECIFLMATFYLSIALSISAVMNLYNRYVQIRER